MDSYRWLSSCGVLLILVAGCARFQLPEAPIEDISETRQQRNNEAVGRFERRRDDAQYQAAISRWKSGDRAGCQSLVESLLVRNSRHRQARLLLADLYLDSQDVPAATQQIQLLLEQFSDDAQAHHSMGLLMELAGQDEKAVYHFRRAAELDPSNELYSLSCQVVSADCPESTNRSDKQPNVADEELVSAAHSPRARAILRLAVSAAGCEPTPEALPLFQEAIKIEAENPQIPVAAAVYLMRHTQTDLAISLVQDALSIHLQSAALYRILGACYLCQGDYQASQVALQQALSLDNSNALSYSLLGSTLSELGEVEQASWYYQQAHLLDPSYPERSNGSEGK